MGDSNFEERVRDLHRHISMLENWWKSIETDAEQDRAQIISTHYLVVEAYGIVESGMKQMLMDYVAQHSHPNVAKAMNNNADGTEERGNKERGYLVQQYGWNFEKIKKTINLFNDGWVEDMEKRLDDQHKASIKSLKDTRDKIAHGNPHYTNFEDAQKRFKKSVEALRIISGIINAEDTAQTQ